MDSVIGIYHFYFNRRSGKDPVPETEAGSAEKGGGPHPEEDRSRP